MNVLFLALVIPVFIRGLVVYNFHISPFFGAHALLIGPDIFFCSIALYWLQRVKKIKLSFPVACYFFAFVGSIFWDYQSGYYALKICFPAILFFILNQKKFEVGTIGGFISSVVFALFSPLVYFSQLISQSNASLSKSPTSESKTTDSLKPALIKAGIIGVVFGVIILGIVSGLDPEFGKFLNLDKLWQIVGDSILSAMYYLFILYWYFLAPVNTKWETKEQSMSFLRLMQSAIIVIVAIIIGYSLYDMYIVLRVLHLLSLVFETIGKNTQLYFLELVFLGGGLMYSGSFLISQLQGHEKTNHHARKMNIILIITLSLLIPPIVNILRALLIVYIPTFGLTALRLFGITTTASFVIAFSFLLYTYFKREKFVFTKSLLGFILPFIILSFALPNNLIVANWHFQKYMKGEEADFNYFRKIRLEKWGGIFLPSLEYVKNKGNKYFLSDQVWGFLLARETLNDKKQQLFKERMVADLKEQSEDISQKMIEMKFDELIQKYGARNKQWVSLRPVDSYIHVEKQMATGGFQDSEMEKAIRTGLSDPYFFSRSDWGGNVYFLSDHLRFIVRSYQSLLSKDTLKSIYVTLDVNKRSSDGVVMRITSSLDPLWNSSSY